MTQNLRIAICQFPVTPDIKENTKSICGFMKKAAKNQSHLIHFPETALSGYGEMDLSNGDWQMLEDNTKEIIILAEKLNLWVVLGSCRKVENTEKPANCIYVISNTGKTAGIYDKQKLTSGESAIYTAGKDFLVIKINGIKCGFLICHELCFPVLFETYRKQGVQIIFHSCYNISKKHRPLFQELALAQTRIRAADNQIWISSSNSSARISYSTACLARPDGSVRRSKKHKAGILFHDFPDKEVGWIYDNQK